MYRPKIMPPRMTRIFIVMQARAGELLLRARRAAEREQEFILAMMQQLVVGLLIFLTLLVSLHLCGVRVMLSNWSPQRH
jgi:hypothetical protein